VLGFLQFHSLKLAKTLDTKKEMVYNGEWRFMRFPKYIHRQDTTMKRDILRILEENMSSFSKGQKLIAKYILQEYDKAAYMTASKLGQAVGVSESTVVLYFDKRGDLRKELQDAEDAAGV
jgi:hypothetical protein